MLRINEPFQPFKEMKIIFLPVYNGGFTVILLFYLHFLSVLSKLKKNYFHLAIFLCMCGGNKIKIIIEIITVLFIFLMRRENKEYLKLTEQGKALIKIREEKTERTIGKIMQTILGSGGVIGKELAKSLKNYNTEIRLVSRNPKKVHPTDDIFSADLTNQQETRNAVKNSQIAYLTVGLHYKTEIWMKSWPVIMSNVINACKEHSTKLVFFDNVYMYGKVDGWMTEETSINPCSKKGEVRTQIAEQLMDEVKKGNIQALIARSADFYGPNAVNTMVSPMVFEKLKNGKKANWILNDKAKHSMTYTPDAGKATALLGNTVDAYNQVWHLPTDRNALTGEEFIKLIAEKYGVNPKYSVLNKFMITIAGLFNSLAKESMEMLYQLEYEYLFDSSKFEKQFFPATTYEKGIEEIVEMK